MPIIVTLKPYLEKCKLKRKNGQSEVPNLTEFANIIGMHRVSFFRLASGKVGKFDLDVAGKIIAEMRRRGYDMQISNLLEYEED
jgi:hypothetical protein